MLEHIHIENFRLFKNLDIPKVGQVNLITGKNNSGKTTLLEALRIYQNVVKPLLPNGRAISMILQERGDLNGDYLHSYNNLFYGVQKNINLTTRAKKLNNLKINGVVISLQFDGLSLSNPYTKEKMKQSFSDLSAADYDISNYIPASFSLSNAKLWKDIELTDKEKNAVEILKIIEPNIVRVSINEADGTAKVRLKNLLMPLPLKNFGEGMNRLLTVALGLVSAENDMLLIDEIDLGLHHSVQRLLWEIVFQKAKDLNVQVFATTHSSDCVQAFSDIANKPEYAGMGKYIRLQLSKKEGVGIMAVDYDMEALESSLDFNLETR